MRGKYNKIWLLSVLIIVPVFISCIFIANQCVNYANENKPVNPKPPWQPQNRSPVFNYLFKIDFVDSLNGKILGDGGIILKTSDAGKTWLIDDSLSGKEIVNIIFQDKNTCYALDRTNNTLLKTTKNSQFWKPFYVEDKLKLSEMCLLSNDKLVVSANNAEESNGYILLNNKNDSKWDIIYQSPKLATVFSLSTVNGNIYATGRCSKTNDYYLVQLDSQGKVTNEKILPKDLSFPIVFNQGGNIWVAGRNKILKISAKTYDSQVSHIGEQHDLITKICFVNENTGFALGSNSVAGRSFILNTENGGKTWQRDLSFSNVFSLAGICFINEKSGFLSGTGGIILSTVDGGKTWNDTTKGYYGSLQDVCFLNKDKGWALGGKYEGVQREKCAILYTENGGTTWITQYRNDGFSFNSLFFVSEKEGWAVGNNGKILHTIDGGKSWIDNSRSENVNYECIFFNDARNGWLLADTSLYKTEDCGYNWFKMKIVHNIDFGSKITFPTKKLGFIAGYGNSVVLIRDGGMTWQKKQISNHLYSIENIYFINQDEGWLTGEGISYGKATDDSACGVVFQTKDSGNSWTEISPPIKYRGHIKDVFFINSQVGWISGEYGLVMKTTDGGKTWKQQSSGTANNLNKIFFIDEKTGWIVGDFGTILFTETGGE